MACNYCTNLYFAVLKGIEHQRCFEYLLQNESDVNRTDSIGYTPLMEAMEGKDEMYYIQRLVENGANVNHKSDGGTTALHESAFYGKDEAIKFLVSKGAKIDVFNNYESTALSRAIESKQEKCVLILLSLGANPNLQDKYGNTPLHDVMFRNSNIKIIEHLLQYGANPHIKNNEGNSPYMLSENNKEIRDLFDANEQDIKEPNCE